ncbi:ribonuclease HII [Desulfobacter hydrogenophilus]|uniref:Ribonuclease HII n=2 Tax=Desulfobacter hydrogenophilus TaxID=2291 RepID=A0A328FGH4_9BACT|nr:ribonuclease HII [Desulfobacter hydrogenophilus]QBH15606.1 ribonuclease HII [Desulfobacter hydrogenophilus]RAM02163.1 ribonuclease HII [Desulfobacter hydrogenophilus]
MLAFEKQAMLSGYKVIAGVDEAGRGPLAGPVVSAAVVLPDSFDVPGINDSKKLSEKKRETLFPVIQNHAIAFGIGMADHEEIDRINILQASLLSMKRAVEDLQVRPDYLLIDGKFTINSTIDQRSVIKGDALSLSIAAASIIAKVTRDRIMAELDLQYPEYGLKRHKGYPTKAHKEAILTHGPCPVHRKSFKGVKDI